MWVGDGSRSSLSGSAAIVSRLNFLNKRYYSSNGTTFAETIHNSENSDVKGKDWHISIWDFEGTCAAENILH